MAAAAAAAAERDATNRKTAIIASCALSYAGRVCMWRPTHGAPFSIILGWTGTINNTAPHNISVPCCPFSDDDGDDDDDDDDPFGRQYSIHSSFVHIHTFFDGTVFQRATSRLVDRLVDG